MNLIHQRVNSLYKNNLPVKARVSKFYSLSVFANDLQREFKT